MMDAYRIVAWRVKRGHFVSGSEHIIKHSDGITDRLFLTWERADQAALANDSISSYRVDGPTFVSDSKAEKRVK